MINYACFLTLGEKMTRLPAQTPSDRGGMDQMFDFSILRELRRNEGLTLAALSQRTGVSPAVISKLERNHTVAELPTLFALSRAYGLNVTDLLKLAESRTAHRVAERSHRAGAFLFREVAYGNLRALVGRAKAGGTVSHPEAHRDEYEICWVLAGRVRVKLPHERHELGVGDCVQFDAILEHTYEVLEACEILILHLKKGKRF
jgi:transcriptional regulator with XRE-family HTH domain